MTEALTNQSFIALALLTATSLVAGFFAYLYNLKRRPYLLYWALGCAIVALSCVAAVLSPRLETVAIQATLNGLLRAGGTLLLSGILSSQEEKVRKTYAPEFRFYNVVHRQEWLRMDGLRL